LSGMKQFKYSDEYREKLSRKMVGNKRAEGCVRSEETRSKISKSRRGMRHSEEAKRKMSESHLGLKCSEKTKQKISNSLKGEKHPFYGKKRSDETRQMISKSREGKCMGEEHPNWNNGSSFEPYGVEFNKELREQIRKRDGYVCQKCGVTQEETGHALSIHHIDYNKKNNKEINLISLCCSCHTYTNYGRDVWQVYFENIIGGIENFAG